MARRGSDQSNALVPLHRVTHIGAGQIANGDGRLLITVDDDGPGIAPSMREAVLQRGVRADQAAPGSGFGLAIVRELAELYEGSIMLDVSPLGGLRAQLQLPGAAAGRPLEPA